MERLIASSSAAEPAPPRLMFTTAGLPACAVIQSTPETTCPYVPDPAQSRTRTATSFASFAMP
jgi:hypothetical protein